MEFKNITLNDTVVKDIKYFVYVNRVGSSKLIDFKV